MKKFTEYIVVVAVGLLFTYLFAGDVVKNINHRYFAQSGDGAKDYYATFYHIKHDKSYIHSNSMNYPFGESIFFAGSQPIVSNTIKFISQNIYDVSPYTVAIYNLLILISIAFTVLVIYLIFKHLNLPIWYSLLVAIGITFLSPQIDRIGGHFALSYTIVLPLFILLLLKFHRQKSIGLSVLILFAGMWASITHGYFFTFYMVMFLAYWIWQKPWRKEFEWRKQWLHVVLQIAIPLIVVPTLILYIEPVEDRTTWPWGFLFYRAFPESVFLSPGRPYWGWLNSLVKIRNLQWEGIAYVGLVSTIIFLIGLFSFIKNAVNRRWGKTLTITSQPLMDRLFWLSFLLLLFSFGIPFIFKLEFLLEYLGPIRQFRGIGRFAWLFYYTMNIVAFYLIWQKVKGYKPIYRILLVIPIAILLYDACFHSKSQKHFINNSLPELDYAFHSNSKPNINIDEFQAIMPIPFFSVGSENYWHESACFGSMVKMYALSQLTGLPLNATYTSRSSVWRCVENLNLIMEPLQEYPVLKYYNHGKDILLFVDPHCDQINQNERRIITISTPIDTLWGYELRRLKVADLAKLPEVYRNEYLNATPAMADTISGNYYFQEFESTPTPIAFKGNGALKINRRGYTNLYWGRLPNNSSSEITVSFWVNRMKADIVPRNRIEIVTGKEEGKWETWNGFGFMEKTKAFWNDWALVEYNLKLNNPSDFICISVAPLLAKSGDVYIDNVLIKPSNFNVKFVMGDFVLLNNRLFNNISIGSD
ncbi:MAG: hypothetical protein WBJ36_03510 [Tenuifilum sp.]|uniref:hypothetical protein n=1 Tax=Tenuifilum sp. TaxID=2760880 RepID=UPI003CB3D5CA